MRLFALLLTVALLIPSITEAKPMVIQKKSSREAAAEGAKNAAFKKGVTKEDLKQKKEVDAKNANVLSKSKKNSSTKPVAMLTYKSTALGISLKYPNYVSPGKEQKMSVTFGDLFISAQKAAGTFDAAALDKHFETLYKLSAATNANVIPAIKNVERSDATLLGQSGRKYTFESNQATAQLQGVLYLAHANGRLYLVRYISDPDTFAKGQQQVTDIVKSMQLLPAGKK